MAAPPVETAVGAATGELEDLVAVFVKEHCSVAGTHMLFDGLTTGMLKLPAVPAAEGALA